jgi:hypothetical protein
VRELRALLVRLAAGGRKAVALDRKVERAAERFELRDRDIAKFREADPQITEAKGDVGIVRVEFREEPGRLGVRGEEFDDRAKVDHFTAAARSSRFLAVLQELLVLRLRDELRVHVASPEAPVRGGMRPRQRCSRRRESFLLNGTAQQEVVNRRRRRFVWL